MSAPDDEALRLAAVVDRQRREIDRLRVDANAGTVVATATGLLMERLGCSAGEARTQLVSLAQATGVPLGEMAATVVGIDPHPGPAPAPGAPAAAGGPPFRPAGGLAADGQEFAATLAAQVAQFDASTVAVWLLTADGVLELLGESGLGSAAARRWRHIPPQLDCPPQLVAKGAADLWWETGRPVADEMPVTGSPDAPRAVLALRERTGELLGVLELRWPPDTKLADETRQAITAIAAGTARVLAVRLAHGDLGAGEPRQALFDLLDEVAGSVLVVRAIRERTGAVTDFTIEHMSAGYIDPAGRPAAGLRGLTLLEAYPLTTAGHGLFARALQLIENGEPQYVSGPLIEPVPLADFRAAKFFDGAIFTWRPYGEAGGLTGLLDHVQRLGRLGGWEENLAADTVRWTDSAFELFGLTPSSGGGIRLADLHSYVMAADKIRVRRFRQDLIAPVADPRADTEAMTTTFRIVRPDGSSIRQIRIFAEPVADGTGTVVALRGAFQDVSAHYLTQVALAATRDQLADSEQRAAEEHLLALRLQRAILPPESHPVEAAGMDVAVRYRPAGSGHLVGGDWYDTLVLPGKDVLLVVGDVAGHGIEAVTGMIAARNALRGLAVTGAGPAELLRLLNVTLCQLVSGVIGTVICGIYSPESGTLRWARAGHLPPVVVRDTHARTLPLPGGVLLGMDPDACYEEVTQSLRTGDTMLFFTDGLIEQRGESIADALRKFVAAAGDAAAPGSDADACADELLAGATSDTDDDACLVAIRIL
ncbi:MAG: SpoIIE family protein phosphatase [Streptosporangiaceae bacterium]|nr:SpoIIE family protein phosphatase [Streptosporangiaceae bacterium]